MIMSYLVAPITLVFIAAIALVCFGLLVWRQASRARHIDVDYSAYPGLARVNRWTLWPPYIGLAVALVALLPLLIWPIRWINWQLLPAILGCAVELGLIIGQLVCFKAARQPGTASLERRKLSRYMPLPLVVLLAAMVAGTACFVIAVSYLIGVGQTSVEVSTTTPDGQLGCTTSIVFGGPNLATTGNMIILLLVTVVLAAIAATIGARRPRNGADPTLAAGDDALRRRSLQIALATATGTLIISLAIAALDLLNLSRSYYIMAGTGSECSFNFSVAPAGPPAGWPFWTVQDNIYNALAAVMVACLLLALIAAASITTTSLGTTTQARTRQPSVSVPGDVPADSSALSGEGATTEGEAAS